MGMTSTRDHWRSLAVYLAAAMHALRTPAQGSTGSVGKMVRASRENNRISDLWVGCVPANSLSAGWISLLRH